MASHGFVARDPGDAKDRFHRHENEAFADYALEHGGERGLGRPREVFDREAGPGGMVFAGGAEEIAERLIAFHRALGHSRHILQMDLGHSHPARGARGHRADGHGRGPMVRAETAGG